MGHKPYVTSFQDKAQQRCVFLICHAPITAWRTNTKHALFETKTIGATKTEKKFANF